MTLQETLLGRPLTCTITRLDDGIHVLFTGGDLSHIGAVSVCDPGSAAQTLTMPGHKEQYISAPWAKAIADASGLRCCVVCGIHYDGASPEPDQCRDGCGGSYPDAAALLPIKIK